MAEYKRTQTVIDTKFQMHYLTVWLVVTMAMIMFGATMVLGLRGRTTVPAGYTQVMICNAFLILFLSLLMGCYAVMHSHKVAGPAYRIRQSLKRLNADDYGFAVRLREGDYLQEIAVQMNELILRLKERQARVDRTREELAALRKSLAAGPPGAEDLGKRLDELLEILPALTPVVVAAEGPKPATA